MILAMLLLILCILFAVAFVLMIVAALMDFGGNPHLHGLYGHGGSEDSILLY